MRNKVLIIGTGLAAAGCARFFVERGMVPIVFDVGERLAEDTAKKAQDLASISPSDWPSDVESFFSSNTHAGLTNIPTKKIFGSSFFYGKSRQGAIAVSEGRAPPFSYAMGGLSVGWGASVLPPAEDDILTWPIDYSDLNACYDNVSKNLPLNAEIDSLNKLFPLPSDYLSSGLEMPVIEKSFLERLKRVNVQNMHIGRARNMVRKTCKMCGHCMGGCVYGAIYSSKDEFDEWANSGKIELYTNRLVTHFSDTEKGVLIHFVEGSAEKADLFDYVFIGAGAVNSSRIYLNSSDKLLGRSLTIKSRGGFVVPVFSFRRVRDVSESKQSLPSFFIETKDPFSGYWIHTQVSIGNELLEKRISKLLGRSVLGKAISELVLSRLFILFVNFHSDLGGEYQLHLRPGNNPTDSQLHTKYMKPKIFWKTLWHVFKKMTLLFVRAGCVPIWAFLRFNSGTYHVGCSLPMKESPAEFAETNPAGQTSLSKKVSFIDSSAMPSLPGTSIGMLSMANAYRITKMVFDNDKI